MVAAGSVDDVPEASNSGFRIPSMLAELQLLDQGSVDSQVGKVTMVTMK